jgi:hypothetical protein
MGKADKILAKMKQNPRNWRIDSIKTVAKNYDIQWRQKGTSHLVFIRNDGKTLPIPAHRPIKPIYVRKFIDFVEH